MIHPFLRGILVSIVFERLWNSPVGKKMRAQAYQQMDAMWKLEEKKIQVKGFADYLLKPKQKMGTPSAQNSKQKSKPSGAPNTGVNPAPGASPSTVQNLVTLYDNAAKITQKMVDDCFVDLDAKTITNDQIVDTFFQIAKRHNDDALYVLSILKLAGHKQTTPKQMRGLLLLVDKTLTEMKVGKLLHPALKDDSFLHDFNDLLDVILTKGKSEKSIHYAVATIRETVPAPQKPRPKQVAANENESFSYKPFGTNDESNKGETATDEDKDKKPAKKPKSFDIN